MSRTDAQIAASRNNGRLSQGPITDEGKARSALNSVEHGLRSHQAHLPGEDLDAVNRRREQLVRDLKPRDHLDMELVEMVLRSLQSMDRCDTAIQAFTHQKLRSLDSDQALQDVVQRDQYRNLFPTNPGIAVEGLRARFRGCEWLIEHWQLLESLLAGEGVWDIDYLNMAIQFLGVRPDELFDNLRTRELTRCAYALVRDSGEQRRGDWLVALSRNKPQDQPDEDFVERTRVLIATLPTKSEARAFLKKFCADMLAELGVLRSNLVSRAEAERAEAALALPTTFAKEITLMHRYYSMHQRTLRGALRDLEARRKERARDPFALPEGYDGCEPCVVEESGPEATPSGAPNEPKEAPDGAVWPVDALPTWSSQPHQTEHRLTKTA